MMCQQNIIDSLSLLPRLVKKDAHVLSIDAGFSLNRLSKSSLR